MNLLYFILYFICISAFSVLRGLSLEISPWFFFYTTAQAAFEVGIFFFIATFLHKRTWIYSVYLTFLFCILLLHYAHFTIHRLTDSTLGLFFKFFIGHGMDHVFKVFQAMNMNRSMILIIVISLLFLPFISFGIYRGTQRLVKPRNVSSFQVLSILIPLSVFLLFFDWLAIRKMPLALHAKYQKTLALGTTLFSPKIHSCIFAPSISPPYDQNEALKTFDRCIITEQPNIYLFIIETLRRDYITEHIAPHIYCFGKENIQFSLSHSNANSTQHSWFAIFHSLLPYHWAKAQTQGSVPLKVLKNLGYKIHVFSSADLRYFAMDQIILGPNRYLADVIEEYASMPIESWEKDKLVMQSLANHLQSAHGNVFLIFLDATHSEYSFPPEYCFYQPIVKKIDYLTLNVKNIEPIINRYRNSVRYIDSLMHNFINQLKSKGMYDDAMIAITGDHGEEFFEEGSLFHGTHLNEAQTCVPILFKFPNNNLPIQTDRVTHIDIFPTLLDYVTKRDCTLFEGKSVFRKYASSYRVAVAQNGAKAPAEFIVQNDSYRLHGRFLDPENIYSNQSIQIFSECGAPEQISSK